MYIGNSCLFRFTLRYGSNNGELKEGRFVFVFCSATVLDVCDPHPGVSIGMNSLDSNHSSKVALPSIH